MVNEDLRKICKNLENKNIINRVYENENLIRFNVNHRGNFKIVLYLKDKFEVLGYDVTYVTYAGSIRVFDRDYKKGIDEAFTFDDF